MAKSRGYSGEPGRADWLKKPVPEKAADYPEARMFGRLPAFGLYARHVRRLRLRDLTLSGVASEPRPALVCDDVQDLVLAGLQTRAGAPTSAVVQLTNSSRCSIGGCVAPTGIGAFLKVAGEKSREIALIGNDLSAAEKPVELEAGAQAFAVAGAGNLERSIG